MVVAAANGVGGDGAPLGGGEREPKKGGRRWERSRGSRGSGHRGGVRGRLGNASVEAGGGRGGIGARHRAASVRGEEDDKGEEVGWAAAGCTVLGQVSGAR